jgi:hypothetical protein
MPAPLFQRMVSTVLRIPRPGALRDDPVRLDQPDVSRSTAGEPAQ